MMDFDNVYELTGCDERVALARHSKTARINAFEVGRGEAKIPRELTFVRPKGNRQADILGTGFASLYLISERLVSTLISEGVSGWRSEPVKFAGGTAADGEYHALSVLGRCGRI